MVMETDQPRGDRPLSAGFVIGEWTVLPSRNIVERGGEEVRVEPRVMDVLVHLARRAGEAVRKEELAECVWRSQFISDETLSVTIYALRKVLGDDARRPRYIETVSRRGYRLIVVPHPLAAPATDNGDIVRAAPEARRTRSYRLPAAAAAALAVVLAGLPWLPRGRQTDRHVPRAEAREAYLKGRYFLDQRSVQSWRQALEQFQLAVALDPRDPAGHAGLADTYSTMSDLGVASSAELRPRAMSAARRALALDARSAEAHEALGRAQFLFDWDFAAAKRSLTSALALDSTYMPAHQAMAWLKSTRGDYAGAVAAARRALQLDPVNTARYMELAYVLVLRGQHEDALTEIERALELDPRSFGTHLMKGWIREVAGEPDLAFAAYLEGLRIVGAPERSLKRYETAYREQGLIGFYRSVLSQPNGAMQASETWRAQLYVRAGEPERAIESLERAYAKREGALAWMNVEPTFRPLRSDARFRQIAAQVAGRN
jgi:transcriptional activator of cad operon